MRIFHLVEKYAIMTFVVPFTPRAHHSARPQFPHARVAELTILKAVFSPSPEGPEILTSTAVRSDAPKNSVPAIIHPPAPPIGADKHGYFSVAGGMFEDPVQLRLERTPRRFEHAMLGTTRTRTPSGTSFSAAVADLDVIIPAYNEELRIGAALDALCREFAAQPGRIRVLVVDNGSVDGTVEVVDRVRRLGVRVDIVNCRTPGKGAAVRAGVAHATARYVAYIDADTSVPPYVLATGLSLLEHGWDGIIGSRRALGGRYAVAQPLMRRIGSRAFNVAARTIVGPLSDTQCGMKMFRRDVANDLFADSRIDGFAFDVEILARARAARINLMELPITWTDSAGSSFAPLKDGIASFREIGRVHLLTRKLSRVA
jgi:dolichyl-phosphate beta-glucosyltransferase